MKKEAAAVNRPAAAVRKRGVQESATMKIDDFIAYVQEKIASKSEEF